jgi:hypothetical protein
VEIYTVNEDINTRKTLDDWYSAKEKEYNTSSAEMQ